MIFDSDKAEEKLFKEIDEEVVEYNYGGTKRIRSIIHDALLSAYTNGQRSEITYSTNSVVKHG